MSQAAECMAYVNSTAAREKFRLLMAAQQEALAIEQTPLSPEEIEQIKDLRKKGWTIAKIAETIGRSASCCSNACRRKT